MSIKCDGAVHVDSQALSFEPCDLAPKAVQHESSSTSPRVPNLANLDSVVFFYFPPFSALTLLVGRRASSL